MQVYEMRLRLIELYPGDRWRKKVEKMSEPQVVAIFKKAQLSGKIK